MESCGPQTGGSDPPAVAPAQDSKELSPEIPVVKEAATVKPPETEQTDPTGVDAKP